MRFRLGLNQMQPSTAGHDALAGGVGNLFGAIAMAPMYRQQAEEQAQMGGLKRSLLQSQIGVHLADEALKRQKLDAGAQTGDVLDTIIAGQAGTSIPTLKQWRDQVRTGQPATTTIPGDPTADAPMTDAQVALPGVDPSIASRILQAYTRLAPARVNPGDFTVQGQAQAAGHYQTQDVLDNVLAGRTPAAAAGAAVAASKGSKMVENIGTTGEGFNIFSGDGVTLNPGLRTLFDQEGRALVGQRNAAAGASGSAAKLSDARRDRVVGGYDKPVTVVDEDTGDTEVTRLPTGADPVTIGLAPKKGTGTDATNAKERNRVTTAVEKEMVGASDAEIAAEVDRRLSRRGIGGKGGAAAAPAAPPALDMGKAADIKAKVKAGTLSRDEGIKQLRALGFK